MLIIPVIDIRDGIAVLARAGRREEYKPVQSLLSPQADVDAVVRAYLSLYPFTTLYVADLDAIQGKGDNRRVIDALHRNFPGLSFWIDAGNNFADYLFSHDRLRPVIGSETGIGCRQLADCGHANRKIILSLDFTGRVLKGDADLLEQPLCWPQDIIIMALHRVGSGMGPEMDLLRYINSIVPGKNLFTAGGVRNEQDLEQLCSRGISGALLATALHNNKISVETLHKYRS